MKNKKGLSWAFGIILAFTVFAITFMFSALLVYEAGQDFIITPTANIGKDILTNTTVLPSVQGVDTISELETDYSNFNMPYDLFFLASFVSIFGASLVTAWNARREGLFSFFGYLLMGSMLLLLINVYLVQFNNWFQVNVISTVFADSIVSTPILAFYLSNMALINFIWWLSLLLVYNIDRRFISRTGEVEA